MARGAPLEELFVGHYFDAEIVVLCARWNSRGARDDRPGRLDVAYAAPQRAVADLKENRELAEARAQQP